MIAARDKAGVYFSRVQHIATFLKVMIHETHRLLSADGAAEVVGSEDNHRSLETRFWNVNFTHSQKLSGCRSVVICFFQAVNDRLVYGPAGQGEEEEGINGFQLVRGSVPRRGTTDSA